MPTNKLSAIPTRPRAKFCSLRNIVCIRMLMYGLIVSTLLSMIAYFGNLNAWQSVVPDKTDIHEVTFATIATALNDQIWRTLSLELMVALSLTLIAVQMVYSYVVRPTEKILETILRRAAGSRDAYTNLDPTNEIGHLAQTLNAMFDTLNSRQLETNKLNLVANITDNAVMIIDESGRIEWTNAAFTYTTGYAISEVFGRKFGEFLHGPLTNTKDVAQKQLHMSRGTSYHGELLYYHKSGRSFWAQVEMQPIRDDSGHVNNYVVLARDITQRKENELQIIATVEELVKAREQLEIKTLDLELRNEELQIARTKAESATHFKSVFLANMSHEIRTPMTAILGYSDIVLHGVSDPDLVHSAHIIKRNGEYLLNLLNDILDLSKIEYGCMQVEQVACSPAAVIDEVTKLLSLRAKEKKLELKIAIDQSVPDQIMSDPIRLRQILINLIGNAIKFTDAGNISLHVRGMPGPSPKLQIEVSDTGIGMSAEQLEKIFQPFAQADESITRKFGGSGLGLNICKSLVELLGGTISVNSLVGKGSCFTFTIPCVAVNNLSKNKLSGPIRNTISPTSTESAESTDPAETKESTKFNGQVLLVEDGPDNQRLIRYILEKMGATVVVADNGWIALNLMRDNIHSDSPYDCILMDAQMPILDGSQATAEIRSIGYQGPIIGLTAHQAPQEKNRLLQAGCQTVLEKPINREQFCTTIINLVHEFKSSQSPAELSKK